MRRVPLFIWRVLLGAVLLAYVSCERIPVVTQDVIDSIQAVKEEYCPDSRVEVFDVSAIEGRNSVVLRGETTSAEAKTALSAKLNALGTIRFADSVVVLPHPDLGAEHYGLVRLSVADVRCEPSHKAELVNQTLLGRKVVLLKKQGNWYYCRTDDNYLGWIGPSSLFRCSSQSVSEWEAHKLVIVTDHFARAFLEPDRASRTVSDLVRSNLLAEVARQGEWTEVLYPDGRTGFVASAQVASFDSLSRSIPRTPEAIIETAKQYIGYPYVWGGTSTKSIDCSGFTMNVFRWHGIRLPRDANMQVKVGTPVQIDSTFSRVRRGDLLFFGPSPERITHTGIYAGDYQFLHSSGSVRLDSFNPDDPNYNAYRARTLRGIRRVLK